MLLILSLLSGLLSIMWMFRSFRRVSTSGNKKTVSTGILAGPESFFKVKLSEILPISDNTKIFRFELPDETSSLGLPVCQHLLFRAKIATKAKPDGEELIRKYTPTSSVNEKGFFDVPIKIYYKNTSQEFPEGGAFSQYLDSLKIGDSVEVAGPSGRVIYLGKGVFQITTATETFKKTAKNVGLICGGTGITPCFQLFQYCTTQGEGLNFSLLYANRSENDILLRPIIDEFVAEGLIHSYFVLEKPPENWNMGVGYISASQIQDRMPPPDKETLIFHCGSKGMNAHVRKTLTELGYSESMIIKF
jgi:cytochrome-b5 reductase